MSRALVLSGGGAKGSWQVGACEHLIAERGHWFDVISGVSVGALNGATLAHAGDQGGLRAQVERLRAWWFSVRGNHNIYLRRRFGVLGLALGKWKGLYDVTPLREEVLRHEIDPEQVAVSPIRLRVGYLDVRSRRYRTAGNDHPRLRDALLASASLPVLFPPTRLPETQEIGVDGGVSHLAPLADALRTLADLRPDTDSLEAWVLLLNPPHGVALNRMVQKWLRRTFPWFALHTDGAGAEGNGTRTPSTFVVSGALGERSRNIRLRILHPVRKLAGSVLDFDPGRIRAWYEDGLSTARSARTADLGG